MTVPSSKITLDKDGETITIEAKGAILYQTGREPRQFYSEDLARLWANHQANALEVSGWTKRKEEEQ